VGQHLDAHTTTSEAPVLMLELIPVTVLRVTIHLLKDPICLVRPQISTNVTLLSHRVAPSPTLQPSTTTTWLKPRWFTAQTRDTASTPLDSTAIALSCRVKGRVSLFSGWQSVSETNYVKEVHFLLKTLLVLIRNSWLSHNKSGLRQR